MEVPVHVAATLPASQSWQLGSSRAVQPPQAQPRRQCSGPSPRALASGATVTLAAVGAHRRSLRGRRQLRRLARLAEAAEDTVVAQRAAAEDDGLARVAKQLGDVVIAVTSPLGEDADNRLPVVGDTVQFSESRAVGHVVAVSDLCFASVLRNIEEKVAVGERYKILSKATRPTVAIPPDGAALIDADGKSLLGSDEAEEPEAETTPWFQEMVSLIQRQRIDTPLHAGVMGLDAFVPIGRGQSMMLRLPAGVSEANLAEFLAHIVKAQENSKVKTFVAMPTTGAAKHFRELVGDCSAAERLVTVAGSESERAGEAVLAMNAACALAERHRDDGGDALLLLDMESLYKVWSVLADVSSREGLAEKANKDQSQVIDELTPELGVELWKYVAKKNAVSARRRTFLGCFLQRAGRMAKDVGGGSLTLLAFARLKDDSKTSHLELQAKLRGVKEMNLAEEVRQKAIQKLEEQLAALPLDGGGSGVPDDFVEEAKAVTDGHVVFSEAAADRDGVMRWTVDVHESVARGITADSVQNRPLHLLKSLKLKMHLMHEEETMGRKTKGAKVEVESLDEEALDLDLAPLHALLEQPVGHVLSEADEAALFLLALDDASLSAEAAPVLETITDLMARARVRQQDSAEGAEMQSRCRGYAMFLARTGEALEPKALCEALDLRPLEQKRVIAAFEEENPGKAPPPPVMDPSARHMKHREIYDRLHDRLKTLREAAPDVVSALDGKNADDKTLEARYASMRMGIRRAML